MTTDPRTQPAEQPAQQPAPPPATTKTVADASAPSTRRPWRRRLSWALLLLVILVLLAPALATRGPGRRWLENRLSEETHLKLRLGSVRTWWWTPLVVNGVEVETESGRPVANIWQLRTSKSLLGLLFAGEAKGELRLLRPDVTVDLEPEALEELSLSLEQVDPTRGLLRLLVRPDRDSDVELAIVDGAASVRPAGLDWQPILNDAQPRLRLRRRGQDVRIDVEPGHVCRLEVSPELVDLGLKYVLPVLAGAVDADGQCSLYVNHCTIDTANLAASQGSGQLVIHSVRAEARGPLLREVVTLVGKMVQQDDVPMSVYLADNCEVAFAVADRVVSHEGLEFGLPRVLPELVLQTRGDIAFDQTLDLRLSAEIPFEKFGEGPVLQRLGSPELAVPVTGTFSAPKFDVGEGQVVKGLVSDLVRSLTDDQIDPAPLLDQIGSLGLLERRRERKASREAERAAEEAAAEEREAEPAAAPEYQPPLEEFESDEAGPEEAPAEEAVAEDEPGERRGLIKRLRDRRRRRSEQ